MTTMNSQEASQVHERLRRDVRLEEHEVSRVEVGHFEQVFTLEVKESIFISARARDLVRWGHGFSHQELPTPLLEDNVIESRRR